MKALRIIRAAAIALLLMIVIACGIIGAHLCGGSLENHEGCIISPVAEDAKLAQMMLEYELNGLEE